MFIWIYIWFLNANSTFSCGQMDDVAMGTCISFNDCFLSNYCWDLHETTLYIEFIYFAANFMFYWGQMFAITMVTWIDQSDLGPFSMQLKIRFSWNFLGLCLSTLRHYSSHSIFFYYWLPIPIKPKSTDRLQSQLHKFCWNMPFNSVFYCGLMAIVTMDSWIDLSTLRTVFSATTLGNFMNMLLDTFWT